MDSLKRGGKIRLYAALLNTRVKEASDLVWEIEFPNGLNPINEKFLNMPDNQNALQKTVATVTGKDIHLKFKKNNQTESSAPKSQLGDLGIDINIIDQ